MRVLHDARFVRAVDVGNHSINSRHPLSLEKTYRYEAAHWKQILNSLICPIVSGHSFDRVIMAGQPSNPVPAMTAYHPLEQPAVVIGPQFLAQYPVDLTIASKVLTLGENDFTVTDVNGTLIFRVKGKLFSIHDRRHLQDAAGNTLVTLRQKIMTMHNRWQVFRGESTEEKDLLFNVKRSSLIQLKTQLDVFLASNTSESVPDFKVKGSWKERSCTIYLGESNTIIAQMYRKHTVTTFLLDTDNFAVTVYPNVDYAFIVALVVVLDEVNADRSGED